MSINSSRPSNPLAKANLVTLSIAIATMFTSCVEKEERLLGGKTYITYMDGTKGTLLGGFKKCTTNWANGDIEEILATPILIGEHVYMPDRPEVMARCVKSIDGNNVRQVFKPIKKTRPWQKASED